MENLILSTGISENQAWTVSWLAFTPAAAPLQGQELQRAGKGWEPKGVMGSSSCPQTGWLWQPASNPQGSVRHPACSQQLLQEMALSLFTGWYSLLCMLAAGVRLWLQTSFLSACSGCVFSGVLCPWPGQNVSGTGFSNCFSSHPSFCQQWVWGYFAVRMNF